MGFAQIFFKKGNYIGDIQLDIIIEEGASSSARVTKNPVENGADINDHIIIEPMKFTISGVVSNVSTTLVGQLSGIVNLMDSVVRKAL